MQNSARRLNLESLEHRQLLTVMHNVTLPEDVNVDGHVSPIDALLVINRLNNSEAATGSIANVSVDVNDDQSLSPSDAVSIINRLNTSDTSYSAPGAAAVEAAFGTRFGDADKFPENLLTTDDVETLLSRASQATKSNNAIIAVVDRAGRILGVRVEQAVSEAITQNDEILSFAIDGAVAKARTAAFFSSNGAPLTSRTVRFISQSTITQREVESSPTNSDARYKGPGLVAPIGVGGHFPPEVRFTPQVDLFAIEHQSRDSQTHPGPDGTKLTADDFELQKRFNANPSFIPALADPFFNTWPESYGEQSGRTEDSIPRGIATLPGGVPLFKKVSRTNKFNGDVTKLPLSQQLNLVGGIGVFFPGEDGFATHEQDFRHKTENRGRVQSEQDRTNANKVLEAEFTAFIAAAGDGIVGPNLFERNLTEFNNTLPDLNSFILPNARLDLVGITLEVYGPTPNRAFRRPGIDRLIAFGRQRFSGPDSGSNQPVTPGGLTVLAGQPVPEGWLVTPHASSTQPGLTAADVERIIWRGVEEAERTRAAIRLDVDNNFQPGVSTRMVLAVADTDGDLLGLYRMPDATIFSIDVSVAKARNTAYYADPNDIMRVDRVDFDGDGVRSVTSRSVKSAAGDTLPKNTALTNRTFRFLAEPRFPTGSELDPRIDNRLVNNRNIALCDREPVLCLGVGPQSSLRLPGINPLTAENIRNNAPLSFSVYASPDHNSTVAFDSFHVMRNFRDPGDATVTIGDTGVPAPLANQNGVVFFPGSTPLYKRRNRTLLVGGFGVSGDGVDQDDVVTAAGQVGFDPRPAIRSDRYTIGGVRLPFQHFNRNPFGE